MDIVCLKGCEKISGNSSYLAVGWHSLQSIAGMVSSGDGTMVCVVGQAWTINDEILFCKIPSG